MDKVDIEGDVSVELKDIISQKFKSLFWEILVYLELIFPHEKGDGSENEKTFLAIRSRVLRIGNDNVRELETIFDSFIAFRLYEYKKTQNKNIEAEIFSFKEKFKIGAGK